MKFRDITAKVDKTNICIGLTCLQKVISLCSGTAVDFTTVGGFLIFDNVIRRYGTLLTNITGLATFDAKAHDGYDVDSNKYLQSLLRISKCHSEQKFEISL